MQNSTHFGLLWLMAPSCTAPLILFFFQSCPAKLGQGGMSALLLSSWLFSLCGYPHALCYWKSPTLSPVLLLWVGWERSRETRANHWEMQLRTTQADVPGSSLCSVFGTLGRKMKISIVSLQYVCIVWPKKKKQFEALTFKNFYVLSPFIIFETESHFVVLAGLSFLM